MNNSFRVCVCVQRVDDLWFFDKRDDSEFGESVYMSVCVYMSGWVCTI